MPRKSKSKKQKLISETVLFKSSKSYVSFLYGVLSVVVLFLIVFISLKAIAQRHQTVGVIDDKAAKTSSLTPIPMQTQTTSPAVESNVYFVQQGDSLWNIAEAKFGDPLAWRSIANINGIENPSEIEVGQKLAMPDIARLHQADLKITGGTYTVVRDDSLWNIAVRAYGDGYKWTDIAQANNLANPDLIHSGNVLVIPR